MMESAILSSALARVRARWRRHTALQACARAGTALALVWGLAVLAERVGHASDATALLVVIGAVLLSLGATAAFAWPLRRRPTDRQVARFVEERYPECADAIVTAVDVTDRGTAGKDLAPLVVAAAARRVATLDLAAAIEPAEARAALTRAAGAVAACALAVVFAIPLLERALDVVYVRLFPAAVTISVAPGDLRVAAGKPATIVASVKGRGGALTRLAASITLDAGGQVVTVPMERTASGYRFQVPSVERSFHYRVSAGPAVSAAYAVTALHAARVARVDLQYDFPSFTGLPPRLERDSGDVYAPAGTRVRVLVHADKPVREGALAFSQAQPAVPLQRIDDRTFAGAMTVARDTAYRVGLIDPDGLSSDSVEYFVRVMDDRPPDIHILRPGGDDGITPLQEVPIEVRADDDFGVQKMDLVYSVAGGPEHVVSFTTLSGSDTARVGARTLAVEDLKVKPGDVIAYYARAWDVARAKPSTMTRSEMFFLEVKPFNEEYSLAQSQAGMQAATATQLDSLISAQKEIISATWNLERRANAGKSAGDVRDVASAQAELKARAERASSAQQPRRRFGQGFLQIAAPSGAAGEDEPVAKAAAAMGRAVHELQGQKTNSAIPHEMAALNALLAAQAEIRKKQVTQQQQGNGGGGFGNRQTQDLSTLFDRELKRQQKTNYEERSEVESQTEKKSEDSALDKIRDLARRQEELARQQRELAKSAVSAEEKARQLEKLTREQEALRRQLEDTARQQRSAAGAQGAQDDLREAMRQMREGASESGRNAPGSAAANGQRAAEALRRAESRMENGSPDAQKRALGDLQLESQQIGQEQRRIANEAERLDREGGGARDARQRLAGDKDRLADRVDALQQAAQRLPGASQAARDLATQQLASKMRETAGRLRDGKNQGRSAPAEQQLADALDRLARTLGTGEAGGAKGDKADTRQLAGDLDELRDARERVARLERDIRNLQQGPQQQAGAGRADGRTGQSSARSGSPGQEGRQGARGSQGAGQGGGDVAALQQQLDQEMRRTRELLDRVQRGTPQSGVGRAATPEGHEWSRSAPGTEAFKQDYSAWQSLAGDVARALERAESSAAARLSAALAHDRLRGGGSERVPDNYRRQVSSYFEAIAVKKQP